MRCARGPLHETTVYLGVDLVQPLLGTIRAVLVIMNLGLQFCDLLLCTPKLLRKRLRHFEGLFAVLLGHTSSPVQQGQDCFSGLVEFVVTGAFFRAPTE